METAVATITSAVETITPKTAQRLLDSQHTNRKVSKALITFLVHEMISGHWRVNGEPIIIDAHGRLIDGQHRLLAIINSGVTIRTLVTRGVDSNAMATINQGKTRTPGDMLSMQGVPYAAAAATVSRILITARETGKWRATLSLRHPISSQEILDFFEANADEILASLTRFWGFKLASSTYLAPFQYVTRRIDEALSDVFFEQLVDGVVRSGSPVHFLREKRLLVSATVSPHSSRALTRPQVNMLVTKAWNALYEGRAFPSAHSMGRYFSIGPTEKVELLGFTPDTLR